MLTTPITIQGNGTDTLTVNGSSDTNPNYIDKSASVGEITWAPSASASPLETVTYSGIHATNI